MPLKPAFLGVDGGGSSARALIIDAEGQELGSSRGPGCNPHNIGFAAAASSIDAAVRDALSAYGEDVALQAAFLGIAGIRDEKEQECLAAELVTFPWTQSVRLKIDHDLAIAYEAALGDKPGLCLICGTGSSCLGKDASGAMARSSGRALGDNDPGSGYAIGWAAIKAGLASCRSEEREAVARLAPNVIELAERGDPAAKEILQENVGSLVQLVRDTHFQLQLGERFDCSLSGGLIATPSSYQSLLADALRAVFPQVHLRFPQTSPVRAAAEAALRLGKAPEE